VKPLLIPNDWKTIFYLYYFKRYDENTRLKGLDIMSKKDLVRKHFSENKNAYITSSTHGNKKDLLSLMNLLQFESEMVALDIATGGGHVAKHLSNYVDHVIATDLTEAMLENTAKHLAEYDNIEFIVADAENLPFATEQFDIITCRIAAHHFPNPTKFIQEVTRTLKVGGQFLLIDNIGHENKAYDTFVHTLEKMRDSSHVRSLKVSEWKDILEKSGLTITQDFSRKKQLPFTEWVERTVKEREKITTIENFILHTDQAIKRYYEVIEVNGQIQSFAIDEWVAVIKK